MKDYHILCFLDGDEGRDPEMLFPLVYFAESVLDCRVEYSFIWNIHEIYRKKPDLILMANTIGSTLHYEVTKYAKSNGIKIFALISEGIYRTDGTFNYFGYNIDKSFHQEYVCHWSERTKRFLDNELPDTADRNVVTGATGFDRYSIYNFVDKESFLSPKKLARYKKVIGYAGWAFGKMYSKQGQKEIRHYHKDAKKRMAWMEEQMFKVEDILRKAIEANPDILFLLKRHPNEANPTITPENPNEMIRLRDYPNVLYITEHENLHDLISVSDIWVGFESTTCIEAWLMGKPSMFINPDPDFNRTNIHKGNPIVKTAEDFLKKIKLYYQSGDMQGFNTSELIENRKEIIRETIGFSDGMNHVRAGFYLSKVLDKIQAGEVKNRKIRISYKFLFKYCLLMIGRFFYIKYLFLKLPKFKKTVWMFENWKLSNLHKLQKSYKPFLDKFYKEKNVVPRLKDGSLWKDLGMY